MRIALLGPLRVTADDGTPVDIGGARLRMLLARLALDPGRFVSAAVLVDALWADQPPSDATNALQSLVSRLRKALHGAPVVESGPAGYRLLVDRADIDAHHFTDLASAGRTHLRAGDPAQAERTLTEALTLWHGPALADVPDAPFAAPVAARWAELRLTVQEDRAEAQLATGHAADALADLDTLTTENPLREPVATLQIRALHATGRTADALAAYHRIRKALATELGVDPATPTQTAHQAVLTTTQPPFPTPSAASHPLVADAPQPLTPTPPLTPSPAMPQPSAPATSAAPEPPVAAALDASQPPVPTAPAGPQPPDPAAPAALQPPTPVTPAASGPFAPPLATAPQATAPLPTPSPPTPASPTVPPPSSPPRRAPAGNSVAPPPAAPASTTPQRSSPAEHPTSFEPAAPANSAPAPAPPTHSRLNSVREHRAEPALPARLTSFVGREADVSRALELLTDARLVSLVGPGGAGKTRLSIEVAFRHVDGQQTPVWFVELAPLAHDADLELAVLAAIGAREARRLETSPTSPAVGFRDPTDHLVDVLGARPGLLVLDNCEHVIGSAARLATLLLTRCPRLHVLATSREPLAIAGETLHWVGPLDLPPDDADLPAAAGVASMRLFVDRAAAARPGFALDADNLAEVTEIVRRMDGMPLALELAAARLRSMTPTQVVRRLDDRFRLLTSGSRVALPRHRTLRGVIEWSWDLLTDPERRLARRLAVFAGGMDEDAATGVCTNLPPAPDAPETAATDATDAPDTALDAPDDDLTPADVPYLLASLVEKSLVQEVAGGDGRPRYRMLETVRAYGRERLAEAGETDALWRAFTAYYATLLNETEPVLRTAGQLSALARIRADEDNLTAVLRHAVDERDADLAAHLTMSLSWYWLLAGRGGEITPWTRTVKTIHNGPMSEPFGALRMLSLMIEADNGDHTTLAEFEAVLAEVPASARPKYPFLFIAEPMLRMFLGDWVGARAAARQAGEIAPDPWTRAMSWMTLCFLSENSGDMRQAETELEAAFRAFEEIGERWGLTMCLSMRGNFAWLRGDYASAIAATEEALRLTVELGSEDDPLGQLVWLGRLRTDQGDLAGAERDLTDAYTNAAQHDNGELQLMALSELVRMACAAADLPAARRWLDRLVEAQELGGGPGEAHRESMYGLAKSLIVIVEGDLAGAESSLADLLPQAIRSRDMPIVATVGERIAELTCLRGDARTAAEILGAAERIRGTINQGDWLVRKTVAALTETLGPDGYAAAVARGADTTQSAAIDTLFTTLGLPTPTDHFPATDPDYTNPHRH